MSKSQLKGKNKDQTKTSTKRKPIGRRLSSSISLDTLEHESSLTYTLSSGREVQLSPVRIEAAQLKAQTFIDPLVNGREQAALTRASVEPICKTIVHQQFFPAIGRRHPDGRIEVIDGSRRRAAALYTQCGLDLLVTEASLTLEEARALAHSIQTAREHNIREVGLRLRLILDSSDMNQKQLAQSQGLSAAKVTRALQAASVPDEMLGVFSVRAELSYPDYRALKAVVDRVGADSNQLQDVIEQVRDEAAELSSDLPPDQQADEVIRLYQRAASAFNARPKAKRDVVTHLWEFNDKNIYARKRKRNRALSFEFNRIPTPLQRDLERVISETLRAHFSDDLTDPSSDD